MRDPQYSIRFVALNKVEIALLTNLCSPEPEICAKTATCFDLMCDEAMLLEEIELASAEDGAPASASTSTSGGATPAATASARVVSSDTGRPNNPIVVNYDLYRKLANAGVMVTGRALQQRSIR